MSNTKEVAYAYIQGKLGKHEGFKREGRCFALLNYSPATTTTMDTEDCMEQELQIRLDASSKAC